MKDNEIKTNKKDKTKGRKIKSSFLFEKTAILDGSILTLRK